MTRLTAQAYTVAWLCALPLSELPAASAMLDEEHEPLNLSIHDENTYTYGSINGHNVIIACLPPRLLGKVSASILAQPLSLSFPKLKFHLFVGIGGGVPRDPPPKNPENDIHLGDVVIGWAERTGAPGVVQWDLLRYLDDGNIEPLGISDKPDRRLLAALGVVLRNRIRRRTKFPEHLTRLQSLPGFSHPGLEHDILFKSTYPHPDEREECSSCERAQLAERPPRVNQNLIFHQGTILSGDSVMKNAQRRNEISKKFHDASCFETEAAGLMDDIRCLIIRGISDYADSHKNDLWQNYAAGTAAAFARELLFTIRPQDVNGIEPIVEVPLSSNIAHSNPAASSTPNVHFMVPFQINGDLIGREKYIQSLETKLCIPDKHCRVALVGLAGSGKTWIALEYASKLKKSDPVSAFWVHASTAERMEKSYQEIAKEARLFGAEDPQVDQLQLVKQWLEGEDSGSWVMIIDNADDEELFFGEDKGETGGPSSFSNKLARYFPWRGNGSILLTTRNKKLGVKFATVSGVVTIPPMSVSKLKGLMVENLEEEDAKSDSSETDSTVSSMWSDSSKSSVSSSASTNDTLVAALDEVIDVFMSDKDLRCLFAEAFIGQDQVKFSRNAVRLLKWLGRRLMVAANTPVEKEAAKFFLGRRHDQDIINRIKEEIVTRSFKKEKQGQIKELRQHESTKQERLESYLQQMEMSTTNREPEETGKVLSDGESDSSSDSDEEKDRKQMAQWKAIDVVKLFLKSGDALTRFKEELEDLISPFRSEVMWTKELWNGRERVRFEHSDNVPRLTMIDKLKLAVEKMLGLPILWWPLKQPRKHLPSSKVRIIWICECGDETYIDVSCAKARRYRQMCDTKPVKFTAAQPSTLPTHNTSLPSSSDSGGLRASTSALIGKATRNLQQRFRGNKSARSASQGSEQNATIVVNPTPNPKFVNWCVDSAPSRTFRHSICLEEKKEKYFIDELYKSYRKLRGWRWYLSMTTCAEIKLVKYDSVYSAEEKDVSCDFKGDVLPNLGDQMEYTYKIDPPDLEKEIHIRRAERALIDYYHGYKRCNDANRLEQLILGIPHRVTGKKHGPKGYGIWARQGWTIPRLAAFFLVTQGWAIVFMAVWLCYHPGDVQNTFSPGYYSLGVVTVFIAIPDVFLT